MSTYEPEYASLLMVIWLRVAQLLNNSVVKFGTSTVGGTAASCPVALSSIEEEEVLQKEGGFKAQMVRNEPQPARGYDQFGGSQVRTVGVPTFYIYTYAVFLSPIQFNLQEYQDITAPHRIALYIGPNIFEIRMKGYAKFRIHPGPGPSVSFISRLFAI